MKPYSGIIWLKQTDSTNSYLQKLIIHGNIENYSVVAAEYQTSGKGQGSNTWVSERRKNLTFSIYFKIDTKQAESLFNINKSIALSIVEFLRKKVPKANIHIKWPNDIMVNGCKIAGILIENMIMQHEIHCVIGIGLNLNQEQFPPMDNKAVSLKNLTSKTYRPKSALHSLVKTIIYNLKNTVKENIHKQFDELLLYRGEKRNFHLNGRKIRASIMSVDISGRLVLMTDQGEELHLEHGQVGYC